MGVGKAEATLKTKFVLVSCALLQKDWKILNL